MPQRYRIIWTLAGAATAKAALKKELWSVLLRAAVATLVALGIAPWAGYVLSYEGAPFWLRRAALAVIAGVLIWVLLELFERRALTAEEAEPRYIPYPRA